MKRLIVLLGVVGVSVSAVFAAIWGLFLFGECPRLTTVLGGAIIICGIVLYSRVTTEETMRS